MTSIKLALGLAALGFAAAQKPGDTPDVHPQLTTYRCTVADGCKEATNYLVLDSSAHWVHQVGSNEGCGNWGSKPNETACPTKEACAENCIMEGQTDYGSVGVKTDGATLDMQLIVGDNVVSPRIYLLDETREQYEMFKLTGAEIAFDVDVSRLPCGMNSALYLSEMLADGGKSALNPGGAAWGTGYCDAQCYVTPFINGEGNVDGKGACCNEMDIWEANSRANQIAPHPCNQTALYQCTGAECQSNGVCDKSGCGWNPYRLGQQSYYGRGSDFVVDTTRPFTTVTQFTADAEGQLTEIHRLYVQDERVIRAEVVRKEGIPAVAYTTDEYCASTGAARFMDLGAHGVMGDAMTRGMVLALSIWWDEGGNMAWLDGAANGAGPCNATEGSPANIRKIEPDPVVKISNLKWGEIGSTFAAVELQQ
ncbi:glycoside hydrolase family 7 protein [Durotheca rogersii]|uniref:glycoside hydrolase family 7 protein n=1 Tax=Durotheca rogersii TaxID=419775 RepID=UPI00221FD46F|nr:glycoside hydrolase family 7 protein [Durotheca rogersii]KAI5866290.1 glycoside hydrolase family 7 protein [Durotheca rogersii]